MAQRYHYSPEKGSVMPCRAEQGGCKFGDQPHFNNLDEVKEFYAEMYGDQTFATHSKGVTPPGNGGTPPTGVGGSWEPKGDGLDGERERLAAMRAEVQRLSENRNDQSIPAAERIAMNKEMRGIQAHADNLEKKIQRQEQELATNAKQPRQAELPNLDQPTEQPVKETPKPQQNTPNDVQAEESTPAPIRKSKPRDPNAPMGMRELNEAVKTSDDSRVLMDGAERGSDRVLVSLARNPKATPESLARAGERAQEKGDKAMLRELHDNPNYPPSRMSGKEFADSLHRENAEQKSTSSEINDDHAKATLDKLTANRMINIKSSILNTMVQGDNQISQAQRNEIIESGMVSSGAIKEAIRGGRYSLEERAPALSNYNLSSMAKMDDLSPAAYTALTSEAGKRALTDLSPKDKALVNDTLVSIASNKEVDSHTRTLATKMYSPSENTYDAVQLHSDPSLPVEAKLNLEQKVPPLRVKGNVERKARDHGLDSAGLRATITESRNSGYMGRAYRGVSVKLNMDKVRELNLTEDEVLYTLGGWSHNAGSHLDMEKGTYEGRIDSGD